MQHVKVDLPKAISMVLEQIEKTGPDFKHSEDPNRAGIGGNASSCYNMFTETEYNVDSGEYVYTYKPGCLIGRVVVDSYEGDKTDVYDNLRSGDQNCSDFWEVTSFLRNTEMLNFEYTEAAGRYLRRVQSSQDNQNTWGAAHAAALSEALNSEYRWGNLTAEEKAFFDPRGKVLDLMEAFRLVSEVVQDKGEDFTHINDPARDESTNAYGSSCVNVFYKSTGTGEGREYIAPGCLVGSAIHQAGWTLEKFGEYKVTAGSSDELMESVVKDGLYSDTTPAALAYLRWVQSSQDNDNTWGVARMHGLDKALQNTFKIINWYDIYSLTRAEEAWLDLRPEWDI